MRTKKFEYYHKDIKQLKKDVIFRMIFSVFFLLIFAWQIISMFIIEIESNLTVMQGSVSVIVLICSIMLCLTTFSYAFKDLRIISAIKMNGKCVSSVSILFSTKKSGFIKLYQYLISFLTLVTSLVLLACLTYSILQITYLNDISFFMPLLLLICISGYNSIYHIKDEIHTQNTVQEQQPLI